MRPRLTQGTANYVQKQVSMLNNTLKQLTQQMNHEYEVLKSLEAKANGQIPNTGPQSLMYNLANSLNEKLRPGNVGDINKIVWPFWLTTTDSIINPNSTKQGNITVTQEAAFIWISYQKVVMLEDPFDSQEYQYVDPDQPGASGKSNGITFSMRDSQSSRTFMNTPLEMDLIGHWKYPSVLATPQLMLPNSNMEFNYNNNTTDTRYRPFITLYGLRVRIEDAKNILSLISG